MSKPASPVRPDGVEQSELGVALVGAGRWGKKLLRVFSATPRAKVWAVCDRDATVRSEIERAHPGLRLFRGVEELLGLSPIDAVVVATPSATHAELALWALAAGKHVFVEKPMATSIGHALLVHGRVRATGRRFMVGHVLEYHPSILRLMALIRAGALGELRYVCCERYGLAPANATDPWWELAPHDFSLLRVLTGREPELVAARRTRPDAVQAFVTLPHAIRAKLSVGRSVRRHKARSTLVVGSEGVAVFDGLAQGGRLELMHPRSGYEEWLDGFERRWATTDVRTEIESGKLSSLRSFPADSTIEPLAIEATHFVAGALDSADIRTDADSGLRVVSALDAGERSMLQGGLPVPVSAHPTLWRAPVPAAHESSVEL
jgi:predicted dehydrogenase